MSMSDNYKDWPITADRYVVYIDVMGFKNMVATQTVESIYEMMKDVKRSREKSAIFSASHGPELKFFVNSTAYSDSIILYSRDGSKESLSAISLATSFFTSELFAKRVPYKGAMAFGSMTLDVENSIFFGQPLIDAYLLQDELCFYGIVVHHTAESRIFERDYYLSFFLQFDCPLKGGVGSHKTIYPTMIDQLSEKYLPDEHKATLDGFNALWFTVSGHLRKYVENTRKYFDYVIGELAKRDAWAKAMKNTDSPWRADADHR